MTSLPGAGGGHTTDSDAVLIGGITVGTRRQYAEQSKAWKHGERSEDQLLQRIWNLADDSFALIGALEAAANRTAAAEKRAKDVESWIRLTDELNEAAEAERDAAHAEKRGLEGRIEQQRRRLAELEAIVADHANHYRKPIEVAGDAARHSLVAWQDQYWRAENAEKERDAALAALRDGIECVVTYHGQGFTERTERCAVCEWLDLARAVLGGPE